MIHHSTEFPYNLGKYGLVVVKASCTNLDEYSVEGLSFTFKDMKTAETLKGIEYDRLVFEDIELEATEILIETYYNRDSYSQINRYTRH